MIYRLGIVLGVYEGGPKRTGFYVCHRVRRRVSGSMDSLFEWLVQIFGFCDKKFRISGTRYVWVLGSIGNKAKDQGFWNYVLS